LGLENRSRHFPVMLGCRAASAADWPARIMSISAGLTEGLSAGSSRNQGKNRAHHRKPTRAEMKKPMRQGARPASGLKKDLKVGEETARRMEPRMRGEKAPPQRARSQMRPPARARVRGGSHRDWMRAMLG